MAGDLAAKLLMKESSVNTKMEVEQKSLTFNSTGKGDLAAAVREAFRLKPREQVLKDKEGELPEHQIFYQGKFWDAKSLLIKFIRRAKKELTVIDAYLGVATLDMLAKRGRGVKIELITPSNGDLAETDFEAFGRQCGNLTKSTCGICHDRFIVVDQKELYLIGASLKDAGRLTFAVSRLGEALIPGLLDSLRKATTARVTYGKKAQEQSR